MCNFGPEINEEDYDKNCSTHPMLNNERHLESISHLNQTFEEDESDGQIMKPYSSFKTNKLNNLSFKMKYLGEQNTTQMYIPLNFSHQNNNTRNI